MMPMQGLLLEIPYFASSIISTGCTSEYLSLCSLDCTVSNILNERLVTLATNTLLFHASI